jgi:glycosyltransferase involved in cell wall biosynthesis
VIPALLAQDVPADQFEIIVADSLSNDGTAEYLAETMNEFPHLRHLPGPYSGRAEARNAGIAAARGDLVLFTDADIIASRDLISRHRRRHDAAVRPTAVIGLEVQVSSYDDYLAKERHARLRSELHPASRKKISWLYFMTGNASVRRVDLDRVGRFDEDFTGYGHEDLELGYRLQNAGVDIVYERAAVNYHWHPVPWQEQQGRMELAGRSTVRFYKKHPTLGVMANLGMTPVSLGAHAVVERVPALKTWIHANAAKPGLARELSFQYHYLTGVKAALADA